MRTEDRLILLCCKPKLDKKDNKKLNFILQKHLDWNYVWATSLENRVIIQISKHLFKKDIPKEIKENFILYKVRIKKNIEYIKNQFERILPIILKYNEIILLRGTAFLYTLYKNRLVRSGGDVDILIDKSTKISILHGMIKDHHYVPHEVRKACPIEFMEYHGNLNRHSYWGMSLANINIKEVWNRSKIIKIKNSSIKVLEPEDNLIYLSYHNIAKGFIRLYRFLDMIEIIETYNIGWDKVIERSKKYKLSRSVWMNFYLLNLISKNTVPEGVIKKLEPSKIMKNLILKVFDMGIVLHDPNPKLKYEYSSVTKNFKKGLLARLLLVHFNNFYKILLIPLTIFLTENIYQKLCKIKVIRNSYRRLKACLWNEAYEPG